MKVSELFPRALIFTKDELRAMRQHLADLIGVPAAKVSFQQLADIRPYNVTFFIAELSSLEIDRDDAEFTAKMAAKACNTYAKKLLDGKPAKAKVETTGKVINPRLGMSIKVKHRIDPL